jgi:adenylate cyclase
MGAMSAPKLSSSRFAKIFVVLYTFLFLVVYTPLLIGVENAGAFAHVQFVWQDFLFRHFQDSLRPGDPRLILVSVDEETGKKYGFPLPRPVYAQALDKLKALGVRTVVFDVMFFEPREGDAELGAATRRFGRVVHLFEQTASSHGSEMDTSLPVKPLLDATKYLGHPDISDMIDYDGHVRRYALFREGVADPLRKGLDAVSLDAAALSAFEDKPLEKIRDGDPGARSLAFRVPRIWLRHEKRDAGKPADGVDQIESPYRRISMLDILSGELSADQRQALKGSIVELGSTALGYYDHYPTPFMETAPGAEFHLNTIDNELHQDSFDSRSRLATMLLIIIAMALTYVFQLFSPAIGAGLTGATLLAWLFYATSQFHRGMIVEFWPPAAALVSAYLVLVVHRVLAESRKKEEIKGLFGQFVSPEVVDRLAQDPALVKLGGEKRDMTVFFLDIAHFTNISEKMDPEALIQFLNKYLSSLSHVIHEHNGTIDKYIGDCIMPFWNAPLYNKDHRADAILAALECQDAIKELNKSLDPTLPEIPAVRIGINSGVVTVGLTGSQKKLQYTVIGDEVNLASRLEGANKFFGSKTIISESTYEGAKDRVAARTLGRVRVVGKETPIKIFEPLAETGKLSPEWVKGLPVYEAGIVAFDARKYEEALGSFQAFAAIFPDDGPGQLYLNRCQEYAVIAPDATWEGVFNLTAK